MSPVTVVAGVSGPYEAGDLLAPDADVLALPVSPPVAPPPAQTEPASPGAVVADEVTRAVLAELGVDLDGLAAAERMRGKAGEVTRVQAAPPRQSPKVLLVGVGTGGPGDLRKAGAALGRACRGKALLRTTVLSQAAADGVRAGVEGLILGGWSPQAWGTKNRDDAAPVAQAHLVGADSRAVERGAVHAEATARARDLAVTPSNVKNPKWLAAVAGEVAREHGLDIEIWDVERLLADGFGGLLAVGVGSASPPCLVRLDYRRPPAAKARREGAGKGAPIVLVGKGITFDTGGLSIKPREAMVPMKTDMSGAAAVLAAMAACRRLGVRRHVVGLLPLAENAVSGSSYRPSDVIRHLGGTTTEVTNTDAEGRLVLADALAYATTLRPAAIVDVATLTGAATLGLGRRHAALFATSEHLAAQLEEAAAACGERVWRLPLVEDYRAGLDSDVADLRHIASDNKLGGGAIVAALFLREFTAGLAWAHLDIAGPARSDGVEHEVPKGATGFGARLLLRWLETLR